MIQLYQHQEVALEHCRQHSGFALFMDQGCGKTLPAIMRILELIQSKQIKDALVIAPKAVLGSWYRDFEKFKPYEQELLMDKVTLVNYDMAWRRPELMKHWGCIILDESHYIKNRTSKRSQFILKLALDSDYRYILTGTPISNGKLEDIWSQYAFLQPVLQRGKVASKILGTYSEFLEKYCILNQFYAPSSYRNVSQLQSIIAAHSYRVIKSQCLDLPKKLPDQIYEIELKEKALYKELYKFSTIEKYEILAENPLSRMIKLRQVCSGFINTEKEQIGLKCEKIKALKEFLEGYEKKLVIFAQFTYSIVQIEALLQEMKIRYVTLDGRQKDKFVWREFQSNASIQVIICQYESACAGIDLFSADTIVYYEPTIRSTTLEQSRDRIHRTGQKNPCSYVHFITKGTLEEDIYRTLKEYGDFTEKLFTQSMNQYHRGGTPQRKRRSA